MDEWRSLKDALSRLGDDELRGLVIFLASGAGIIVIAFVVGRWASGV